MRKTFRCPQGHTWSLELDGSTPNVLAEMVCPECGNSAQTVSGGGAGAESVAEVPNLNPSQADSKQASPDASITVPGYEILRELGRGGMGVVYLARHTLSGRQEVLKVMNRELLAQPEHKERFRREIQAAANLDHVNVIKMHTALEVGELTVLVMEYVDGEDLAQRLEVHGPLPLLNACYYAQQVALALQHALEMRMVHRDIKPQNIFVAKGSKRHLVKVLDFGLAKVMSEKGSNPGLTNTGVVLGTPHYMAPEQALNASKADIRADIYSLGCTLYSLLTGVTPFQGDSAFEVLRAHNMDEARALETLRPEVPAELAQIVRKMMEKDPGKRYQTPKEVSLALAQVIKSLAQEASSTLGVPVPKMAQSAPSATSPKAARTVFAFATVTSGKLASVLRGSGSRPSGVYGVQQRWWVAAAVGIAVLALGIGGYWINANRKTVPSKTLVVLENMPHDAALLVDGVRQTLNPEPGKLIEVEVTPGSKHRIQVQRPGFKEFSQVLQLDAGNRGIIQVQLEADPAATPPGGSDKSPAKAILIPPPPGFVSLFNGKDLAGWKAEGGSTDAWTVEDGAILGQSANSETRSYLLAQEFYKDFVFQFDFKLEDQSNGGVAIRGYEGEWMPFDGALHVDHPIIKLTNPSFNDNVPTGTSHWLKDSALFTRPAQVLELPTGRWHTMEITVRGENCSAQVDGKPLLRMALDKQVENKSRITPGLARARGKIGFQINAGEIRFCNVFIKDLPSPPPAQRTPDAGFIPLFNGKDLAGWKVDGDNRDNWTVADGTIVGRSENFKTRSYLLTQENCNNFVLRFEFNVKGLSHGGVAIRAVEGERMPQGSALIFDHPLIKITNPSKNDQEPTGTMHWLQNSAVFTKPSRVPELPTDQWHAMEITVRGEDCKAVVDGNPLVDVTLDRQAESKPGFTPGLGRPYGKVGFQINTGEIRFRNVFLKSLPVASQPTPSSAPSPSPGFVSLFNGRDLTGWKSPPGDKSVWHVKDGILTSSNGPGHLFSERGDYENLFFRVEARINDKGNSGQYFRTQFTSGFPRGYEAQINSTARDPVRTGSLYNFVKVLSTPVKPGEWFTQDVIADGNHIIIEVNGKVTADFIDQKNTYQKGHFALQQHDPDTVVEFRRIEVKELPPTKNPASTPTTQQPRIAKSKKKK